MSREIEVINCPGCWTDLRFSGIHNYYKCPECNKEVVLQDDDERTMP